MNRKATESLGHQGRLAYLGTKSQSRRSPEMTYKDNLLSELVVKNVCGWSRIWLDLDLFCWSLVRRSCKPDGLHSSCAALSSAVAHQGDLETREMEGECKADVGNRCRHASKRWDAFQ